MRAPRLGGQTLAQLVQQFEDIDGVFSASSDALRSAGLAAETIRYLRSPDSSLLESDLAWLQQAGHHLLTVDSDEYPPLLADVSGAPVALFVNGDPAHLWNPQLAIVGSRNPTSGGLENARAFSRAIAGHGFTITSGLAAGIDGAAHEAALDAGAPSVAVLGCGPDRVYPARHRQLARRIAGNGAVVSELVPGAAALRPHFPARNRIISGLSLGVLVVEAALNSGSLITARLAAEQGREVFALPGSIHNPLAKGCHRLIRDGARLVETDQDILQELAPLAGRLAHRLRLQLQASGASEADPPASDQDLPEDPEYRQLWASLGPDPLPVDSLITHSGLTARAVSAMLLMLELRGLVEAHPGGAFSRTTRGLKIP